MTPTPEPLDPEELKETIEELRAALLRLDIITRKLLNERDQAATLQRVPRLRVAPKGRKP